jgi:heme A synthase
MTIGLGHDRSDDEGSAAKTEIRVYRLLMATAGLWVVALVASLVQFGVPTGGCTFFSSSFIAAVGIAWSVLFCVATGSILWYRRPGRRRGKTSTIVCVGIIILFVLAAGTTYLFSVSDYQSYKAPVTSNCLDF